MRRFAASSRTSLAFLPRSATINSRCKTFEGWDSVHHFTLILALEEALGVSFAPEDIPEMTSVGKIKAVLSRRQHG